MSGVKQSLDYEMKTHCNLENNILILPDDEHIPDNAGLIISQTSCPDIFQEGGLLYMVTYTNLTGQVVKLVGQMPKLTGNCPVTDC